AGVDDGDGRADTAHAARLHAVGAHVHHAVVGGVAERIEIDAQDVGIRRQMLQTGGGGAASKTAAPAGGEDGPRSTRRGRPAAHRRPIAARRAAGGVRASADGGGARSATITAAVPRAWACARAAALTTCAPALSVSRSTASAASASEGITGSLQVHRTG